MTVYFRRKGGGSASTAKSKQGLGLMTGAGVDPHKVPDKVDDRSFRQKNLDLLNESFNKQKKDNEEKDGDE